MEVGEERKDRLRRSLDACRALNAKDIRPGRGESQESGEQDDDDNGDDREHGLLPQFGVVECGAGELVSEVKPDRTVLASRTTAIRPDRHVETPRQSLRRPTPPLPGVPRLYRSFILAHRPARMSLQGPRDLPHLVQERFRGGSVSSDCCPTERQRTPDRFADDFELADGRIVPVGLSHELVIAHGGIALDLLDSSSMCCR